MDNLSRTAGLDNLLVLALASALVLSCVVAVMMRPREFWRWWDMVVGEQRYRMPVVAVQKRLQLEQPRGGDSTTAHGNTSISTSTIRAIMRQPLVFWRWLWDVLLCSEQVSRYTSKIINNNNANKRYQRAGGADCVRQMPAVTVQEKKQQRKKAKQREKEKRHNQTSQS